MSNFAIFEIVMFPSGLSSFNITNFSATVLQVTLRLCAYWCSLYSKVSVLYLIYSSMCYLIMVFVLATLLLMFAIRLII